MDLSVLVKFCSGRGFPLDDAQVRLFERFAARLYELNESMNLTRVPEEECAARHFVDSLMVAEFVPEGSTVLDVGSGPGFPAWPLACARTDLQVTALDSSGKMLRILNERVLPNLEVLQSRAEDLQHRESYDVVTGRAVAPLAIQLEISAPWAKLGGTVVPFRTPAERRLVREAPAGQLGLTLEGFQKRGLDRSAVRLFPVFRKVSPTPRRYPRTWAQIKAAPLAV